MRARLQRRPGAWRVLHDRVTVGLGRLNGGPGQNRLELDRESSDRVLTGVGPDGRSVRST